MNTRKTGAQKEEQVCAYLLSKGVIIRERNFRCRQGEIDIIGETDGYLVFFEVKYRSSAVKGHAAEAVGAAKQRTICRVCDYYRYTRRCSETTPVRFDVITLEAGNLTWIKNAFMYRMRG